MPKGLLRALLAVSLLAWVAFWAILIFEGPRVIGIACFLAGAPAQVVMIVSGLRGEGRRDREDPAR